MKVCLYILLFSLLTALEKLLWQETITIDYSMDVVNKGFEMKE